MKSDLFWKFVLPPGWAVGPWLLIIPTWKSIKKDKLKCNIYTDDTQIKCNLFIIGDSISLNTSSGIQQTTWQVHKTRRSAEFRETKNTTYEVDLITVGWVAVCYIIIIAWSWSYRYDILQVFGAEVRSHYFLACNFSMLDLQTVR